MNTVQVRLERDTHIPLKIEAAKAGKTVQGLASKIIRDWLREQEKILAQKQPKKR